MILVSSCLAGINCKYNGKNNFKELVYKMVESGEVICACAEELGGLSTPRNPSEIRIIDGKKYVFDNTGKDVTKEFYLGANRVLDIALKNNVHKVILKSKSPSCGLGKIYNGEFNGTLINGDGILVSLLKENGIEVISSDEIE